MNEIWTIARVKDELPMVKAKYNGKKYYARVSGRMNKFACVSPFQVIDNKKLVKTIMGPRFEFSWDSIVHALNTDSYLICDLQD